MADPAGQLLEDRALRNAARGLVESDIAYIREGMSVRSLAARLADRVSGGARDIADEAAVVADENKVALGAGLALGAVGLAAWVFRAPLQQGVQALLHRAGAGASLREPE